MLNETLSVTYAALATLPAAMHIALGAGAPLGRYTIGGKFTGRLPPVWRAAALFQAALLVGMALVVLDRGGAPITGLPDVLFWPVVGLTTLTFFANAASPSLPERHLWTPVTLGMVTTALGTEFL